MNDYKFMSMSTSFVRNIEGHDIDFRISVTCKGEVQIAPLVPEIVQRHFPEGLVMIIHNEELLIYPFKNK
jgi:hypothetical protein